MLVVQQVIATMGPLTTEKLSEILETRQIPGSEDQLQILGVRIKELVAANGEDWVRRNRHRLLQEWTYIVAHDVLQTPSKG